MTIEIQAWQLTSNGEPLERASRSVDPESLGDDEVLIEVAGCGVCHTDLGFAYDGVRTRHALPLTLGHEIAGTVLSAGADAGSLLSKQVIVPAVIPCGECIPCRVGRGAICATQFFPGNDDHGGFASHVVLPARGLCIVDDALLAESGCELSTLSVIADAVTTPYQAILNAGLEAGDVAVFIGVGGVGAFGVQLAHAMGAHVVAIDVDEARLENMTELGAETVLCSTGDDRAVRNKLRAWGKAEGYRSFGWKIFETSGHPGGQSLAFALLGYDGHIGVVGYTREPVSIRMSNLMAFDATMRGTWGCLPEHYPEVLRYVLRGDVQIKGLVDPRPMSDINEVFGALHRHELKRRPVLIPDFS